MKRKKLWIIVFAAVLTVLLSFFIYFAENNYQSGYGKKYAAIKRWMQYDLPKNVAYPFRKGACWIIRGETVDRSRGSLLSIKTCLKERDIPATDAGEPCALSDRSCQGICEFDGNWSRNTAPPPPSPDGITPLLLDPFSSNERPGNCSDKKYWKIYFPR